MINDNAIRVMNLLNANAVAFEAIMENLLEITGIHSEELKMCSIRPYLRTLCPGGAFSSQVLVSV